MPGPQELRFRNHLSGAAHGEVKNGADEWDRCSELLGQVADSIMAAAHNDQEIGGRTGPAMGSAFKKSSERMRSKADELVRGRDALRRARTVIEDADAARTALDQEWPEVPHPGTYHPPVGPMTKQDQEDKSDYDSRLEAYNRTYQERERTSQRWADQMDVVFDREIVVMQSIHGEQEPDRPEPPMTELPAAGGPGRAGAARSPGLIGPSSSGPVGLQQNSDGPLGHGPTTASTTTIAGPEGAMPTQTLAGGLPVGGLTAGGLPTGAVAGLGAGGLLGGAALLSGVRGGLSVPGLASSAVRPASGVRPIGTPGARPAGVSGTLGRAGTSTSTGIKAGAVPSSRPVTGARGAGAPGGRNAAGGWGAAGGRHSTGGRGGTAGTAAAAGAGRRSGKDTKARDAERDLFDDGQDWLDDEAAPGVLG